MPEGVKHALVIDKLLDYYGGKKIITRAIGKRINQYFPDISTRNHDIEVEVFYKGYKLRNRVDKWFNGKKKMLVIAVHEESIEMFDEVYVYDEHDGFIKIK